MAANYNCLLFDLDGTLLDFEAAERQATAETLRQFNLPDDDATIDLYSALNAALWAKLEKGEVRKEKLVTERFGQLLEQIGKTGDPVKLNSCYMTCLSAAAHMVPGADELLRELAEFATLAVVSNGTEKIQLARLEKSGLMPYFDEVFVSERLGATKPSPKFFQIVLQALGVRNKAKVLVIGDSLSADIQGALGAGLDSCWCNFAGRENTTDIKPTYTVRSFAELKLVAVGEEELRLAEQREKRHMV